MDADDRPHVEQPAPDYTTLPPGVRLSDTVAGLDTDEPVDPDAVRNVDQHAALRDD
jgi:hypothetical protein